MDKKPFYKSKTIWLNVVLVLTSVLSLSTTSFDLPPEALRSITFLIGLLGIANRVFSTGSSDLTIKE